MEQRNICLLGGSSIKESGELDEKKSILIVEDEFDNREIIRTVAEDLVGCTTQMAVDGEDALTKVEGQKPDLILMDLMLPRLDGFETTRRLKHNAATANIPIIALTALTRPSDRQRALDAGCDDYLDKPFDIDALADKIREYTTDGH